MAVHIYSVDDVKQYLSDGKIKFFKSQRIAFLKYAKNFNFSECVYS